MRIAFVTLHRVYNYGSVLQAYATQRVLEKLGHEVKVIDYISPQRTKKRIIFSGKNDAICLNSVLYYLAKFGSVFLKEMTFGRFVKKNLHLSSQYVTADDIEKSPPIAEYYITGSDQTWNSQYNEGIDRAFFLDFLPNNSKRLAYAASFGKSSLDDCEKEDTFKLLSKYNAISVREDSAVRIVEELGLCATQLIDPTLMLDKAEWLEIASRRLVKESYLILMLLYNEDNGATEYARKIAYEKGLKVVKISWELKKPEFIDRLMTHRSPSDFLSLFNYADFVVTNSFHGTAFSIDLEKQFIVVPRNEYNSRIESLLRLVNLEDRLCSSFEQIHAIINKTIEFDSVKNILDVERKKAIAFLEKNIK